MNKQDNKLAFSVLMTLLAGIALIYTLIMYHDILFVVLGVSVIFLICAYILTKKIIDFISRRNLSYNMQLKDCINDISSQLEAMNGAQSQIGKATFLYTRQAAQTVSVLENNYVQSQEALYKNLAALLNLQSKSTKLMIKYDLSNTSKLISTIKELRNQISDTMIQGFDQVHPDNKDIMAALEDIVNYLKTQPGSADPELGSQLKDVAHELQNISNSIEKSFEATQQSMHTMMSTSQPIITEAEHTPDIQEPVANLQDTAVEEMITPTITAAVSEPAIAEEITEEIIEDLSNTQDLQEPENFTPTFTVVSSDNEPTPEVQPENVAQATIAVTNEDTGKQLSPDEIAALFTVAEPIPQKQEPVTITEEHAEQEEQTVLQAKEDNSPAVKETPIAEDTGATLSPDEIAALFAAAEPAPKKNVRPETPKKTVATTNPKPAAPTTEDANKQLSPDEIAALFASLG